MTNPYAKARAEAQAAFDAADIAVRKAAAQYWAAVADRGGKSLTTHGPVSAFVTSRDESEAALIERLKHDQTIIDLDHAWAQAHANAMRTAAIFRAVNMAASAWDWDHLLD